MHPFHTAFRPNQSRLRKTNIWLVPVKPIDVEIPLVLHNYLNSKYSILFIEQTLNLCKLQKEQFYWN